MISVRGGWRRVCLLATLVTGLALLTASPAFAATFPINEPFNGATTNNPHWNFIHQAHLTNEGTGWLRLTDATNSVDGSAVLDDPFPSSLGIVVDFQYAAWGGVPLAGHRGDGFSFFLMDGSFPASVGISGGGLGYTFLQGGYVGVGFDEFGNFSGGINGPGQMPDHIAIRGAYNNSVAPFTYLTGAPAPGGSVETGSRAGVRSVRMTIFPVNGHLLLSLLSDTGPGTPLVPVITDFDLQAAGQPALPPTFKIGFSGSTGGATNVHEIRNLLVNAPTNLKIGKTATPVVNPRHQVTYTLTATNQLFNPVTDAVVHDDVPAGITDVTWTCAPGANGGTCATPSGSGSPVNALVSLPVEGSTAVVTVHGTASDATAGTTVTDTATITAPADRLDLDESDNTAGADTRVEPFTDLAVTKSASTSAVQFGRPISYQVTVKNNGPGDAADSLLTDPIPAAIDPASIHANGCTVTDATLQCPLGLLAPGAIRTLTINGTVTGSAAACAAGEVVQIATASTSSTDNVPGNDSAAVSTRCTVPVNVSVAKTGPASANLGDRVHYRVTATNHGSFPAPAVAISENVPTSLSRVTWSCTVSDGSACTPSSGAEHTVQTTATIPPGGIAVVDITATASAIGTATDVVTIAACPRCEFTAGTHEASVSTNIRRPSPTLAATGVRLTPLALATLVPVFAGTGLILACRRRRRPF